MIADGSLRTAAERVVDETRSPPDLRPHPRPRAAVDDDDRPSAVDEAAVGLLFAVAGRGGGRMLDMLTFLRRISPSSSARAFVFIGKLRAMFTLRA